MNDLDLFMARTQARLAFFLIIVLVALSLGVMSVLLLPNIHINPEISGLMVQVVTGVLALAGSAVAFFFARHRPPTASDGDNNGVTSSTTTIAKTTTSIPKIDPLVPTQPENPP